MAVGAHEVPVLLPAGPVQFVRVIDAVARVQVKPALAAFGLRARVPRDRQRLHPAIRQFDEVLLQRRHAERVPNLKVPKRPVRRVGADDELAIAFEERGCDRPVREACGVEISEYVPGLGNLHRPAVVRRLPRVVFRGVALTAGRRADVFGLRHRRGWGGGWECASSANPDRGSGRGPDGRDEEEDAQPSHSPSEV